MKKPVDFKRFLQYFIQGLIILAPVTITSYFIYWLFTNIDSLLLPVFRAFYTDPNKVAVPPGVGFIIIISFVLLVGYLSSFFVIGRLLSFFDHMLEKTPGIKIVYSFVKDFSEAFAGKKRKFKKAVLVSVFHPEVWQVGFITNEDLSNFGMHEHVSVYVPQSYAVAGQLFFVKQDRIKLLADIAAGDALKFAISGGVVEAPEITEAPEEPQIRV
ncbi:MAG: DUF502 domain-containing protein [Chitinophagaceae bacterium]